MDRRQAKNIIEAMLFVSDKPLFIQEIKGVLEEFDTRQIKDVIAELTKEYEETQRAFTVKEIAGGFQIVTDPMLAPWLKKLYKTSGADRLTGPSLETLAIVAYKQPVTKPEIEAIRGVNVDGVLKTLIEKILVRIAGRKETIGRPILYGTTQEFLQYFVLSSLGELPKLEEFHFTEKDIELPEHLRKEEEETGPVDTQQPNTEEKQDEIKKSSQENR